MSRAAVKESLGWNPLTAPTHEWPSGLALGPWAARAMDVHGRERYGEARKR